MQTTIQEPYADLGAHCGRDRKKAADGFCWDRSKDEAHRLNQSRSRTEQPPFLARPVEI